MKILIKQGKVKQTITLISVPVRNHTHMNRTTSHRVQQQLSSALALNAESSNGAERGMSWKLTFSSLCLSVNGSLLNIWLMSSMIRFILWMLVHAYKGTPLAFQCLLWPGDPECWKPQHSFDFIENCWPMSDAIQTDNLILKQSSIPQQLVSF